MTREEFKTARKKLKLTQSELAGLLGISNRTVQGYEYGQQKIPFAIESLLNQKVLQEFPIITKKIIEMDVGKTSKLTIEEMVSFCMQHREYFEEMPEIKLLIERHKKDAEVNLMERHIFLKNNQSNLNDD